MLRFLPAALLSLFLFGGTGSAANGDILRAPPSSPDVNARYIFYMHGRWVEMNGQSDHPAHGRYDYDGILSALTDRGFTVIGEERPEDTRIPRYARKIASQVRQLLDKGVAPERITVSGHSKGGSIAIFVAGLLNEPRVNYAILASCGKDGTRYARQQRKRIMREFPHLSGRMLSMHDDSDPNFAACEWEFRRLKGESAIKVLSTGQGHGLFYGADSVWLDPLVEWTLGK